jgi:DNA polymerase-3 subunit beta
MLTPINPEGRLVHMHTDRESPSIGGMQTRDFHFGEGVLQYTAGFCMPFVSTEETRYYLNGVCFEFGDSVVRTVATDGHKLGVRETKTTAVVEEWNHRPIMPRLAMAAILDVMGAAQGVGVFEAIHIPEHEKEVIGRAGPEIQTVREQWDNPRARFIGNGWVVTSKVIDGNFPDWRRVVPKFEGQSIVTMKAAPLIRLARMSKGMRGKSERAVKLEATTLDSITAKMQSPDFGAAELKIEATLSAPLASGFIGLNVGYLAAIAKAMGTPEISMHVQSHGDPMVLAAPGDLGGDFAILMPMRV